MATATSTAGTSVARKPWTLCFMHDSFTYRQEPVGNPFGAWQSVSFRFKPLGGNLVQVTIEPREKKRCPGNPLVIVGEIVNKRPRGSKYRVESVKIKFQEQTIVLAIPGYKNVIVD